MPERNPKLYTRKRMLTLSGERKKEAAILIRRIPVELRNAFRASCVRHGWSMTDYLIERMKELIRSDTKEREKQK